MKVPLITDYHSNRNCLEVIRNGAVTQVELPFKPFVLGYGDELIDQTDETTTMIDLESRSPIDVKIFRTTSDQEARDLKKRNYANGARVAHLGYMEQLFVQRPDFLLAHPNDRPLKFMTFDIEVYSDGSGIFPTADKNPIIAIAVKINGEPTVVFDAYDPKTKDKAILVAFVQFVREADPDILMGYNSVAFDLPFIFERMRRHKLDPTDLCRIPRNPVTKVFGDGEVRDVLVLHGRIHFDVFDSVLKDQTLHGIKSRGLKTVAKHFGIPISQIDTTNTAELIGTEELRTYVVGDVDATKSLGDKYIRNQITLAEMMGVPLNHIIMGYNSFVSKLFHARCLRERNYVCFRSNSSRHGADRTEKFEAAIVKLTQPGFHEKVHKLDFAGQYPSCMMTFNLSPETCRIIAWEDYQLEPQFLQQDGCIILRIPDKNFNCTVVIEIDTTRVGFMREELLKFKSERDKLKKLKKLAKTEDERTELESQQYALKVVMNIAYGYAGLSSAVFSDLSIAIATVGLCRWMTTLVEEWIGDKIVEIDTDGFYLSGWEPDLDRTLTERIHQIIKDTFGFDSLMVLEHEEFAEAYFHRPKNYILRIYQFRCDSCGRDSDRYIKEESVTCTCGGTARFVQPKRILHGTAFKSSNHPRVYDRAIEIIAEAVLNGIAIDQTEGFVRLTKNFDGLDRTAFVKRCRINKDLQDYSSENALPATLGAQAVKELGYSLRPGDQIEYFCVRNPEDGVRPLTGTERNTKFYKVGALVKDLSEINRDYYEEEVDKVLAIFGIIDPVAEDKKARYKEEAARAAILKRQVKKAQRLAEATKDQLGLFDA